MSQAAFNPFSLEGKRILVTGASSGLGQAIALQCARMGAEIVATGRDTTRLEQLQIELKTISDLSHRWLAAELTDPAQRDALVNGLGGEIDGLVHSAGISRLCPVKQITTKHFHEVIGINVEAPVLLTQAVLKKNLLRQDGAVLFISSVAAYIGVGGVGVYSGSKAALIAFARCLATELVKRRIRVNCLCPGIVETPLTANLVSDVSGHYPLGFGKPEDIANAAIYMLSDASRWVTGATLVMDGGLTIT